MTQVSMMIDRVCLIERTRTDNIGTNTSSRPVCTSLVVEYQPVGPDAGCDSDFL